MKIALFGATGALGRECARQALDAGHELVGLVRSPDRLPDAIRDRIEIIEGDALVAEDVQRAIGPDVEAVLFCIGVDRHSPEDLCTDATRHILDAMRERGISRFVWCGGGSNLQEEDKITLGARFVEFFASTFMGLRQRDKAHQLELLAAASDIDWVGVRPLQMNQGPHTGEYRVGFHAFSGFSKITFADCADAMLKQLEHDDWVRRAPIVCY